MGNSLILGYLENYAKLGLLIMKIGFLAEFYTEKRCNLSRFCLVLPCFALFALFYNNNIRQFSPNLHVVVRTTTSLSTSRRPHQRNNLTETTLQKPAHRDHSPGTTSRKPQNRNQRPFSCVCDSKTLKRELLTCYK